MEFGQEKVTFDEGEWAVIVGAIRERIARKFKEGEDPSEIDDIVISNSHLSWIEFNHNGDGPSSLSECMDEIVSAVEQYADNTPAAIWDVLQSKPAYTTNEHYIRWQQGQFALKMVEKFREISADDTELVVERFAAELQGIEPESFL